MGPLYDAPHDARVPTIYVDGGARFRGNADGVPTISVGDGDSSPVPVDKRLPEEKDFSDLAFALRALPISVRELNLLGFLGGRRDHELLNFGEVHHFLKARAVAHARADFDGGAGARPGRVTAIAGGRVKMELRGLFSVVAFEQARVKIAGACKFPFEGQLAPVSSLGLSNEGSGHVEFETDNPIFIFCF